MTRSILVVGATGKSGRRVAERLTARGLPVRAASRSSQTRFDWNDKSTWSPALDAAGAACITYYADLAQLAVASGVKRLVLLSGRNEAEAQLAERKVKESGAGCTLVRCAFFMQNFSEIFPEVLDGRNSNLTDGVERALGRTPRDFADWAMETAAAGVWDLSEAAS